MNIIKKTAVLLLAAFLTLFSACRATPGENSSALPLAPTKTDAVNGGENTITLLYSASDTLDPYSAATELNRQLCRLLFEPLVKLDNEFHLSYSLAKKIEIKGKTCTVTLANKKFSDGSALTAADVVYSFQLAKASSTEYGYKLYEAVSAKESGSDKVVFTMAKADPYFANLLDFPILKKGSEKRATSDGVTRPPIGCGRYAANENLNGLVLNTESVGNGCAIQEIRLIDAPDAESISHYVEVSAADLYYSDIADGRILRMSGQKVDINLNHLVMIGVNHEVDALAETALRQALSTGIDRSAICRESYYNNALAANGFYNPVWEEVAAIQNIEIAANQEITIANLEKIGYNSLDSDGVRKNGSGSKLRFTLLVNSENSMRVAAAKQIAAQLWAYGIKIEVKQMKYKAFADALEKGSFQLYLAEVAITPNMDLSELVLPGGSAAFGVKKEKTEQNSEKSKKAASSEESDSSQNAESSEGTAAAEPEETVTESAAGLITGLYNGSNTIGDIAAALQNEMPFIPVCYRTGVLFYHDDIENVENSSASDIFFSIESYTIQNH